MASKSKTFETEVLNFIFNGVAIPNLGANFYVRLYNTNTVDNTTVGTEATYNGYVAGGVLIVRTASGFTVADSSAKNTGQFVFGTCTAGTETLRYFAIFKDNTTFTESHRTHFGQLPADLLVSVDTIPTIPADFLIINES